MGIKSTKNLDVGENNTLTIVSYGSEEPELIINGDHLNYSEAMYLINWIRTEFLNKSTADEPCPCVPLKTPADTPYLPKDFFIPPVTSGPKLIGLEERKAVSSAPMRQIMSNGAVIEAKDDLEVVDMAQLKKSLGA